MVSCTKCNSPLPGEMINTYSAVPCPSCAGLLRADVYPALYRESPTGHAGDSLQLEKEAGCFYHPRKKAVVPCSTCGRFVCALCDVAINGQHLCPSCFEKGKTKRKILNLENQRICYDTIALLVATGSILLYWFSILTAPFVIYLTIRHWNSPSSIIPRTKIRFVLAFIIAGLQLSVWIVVFSKLFFL
mgnify:FL=1